MSIFALSDYFLVDKEMSHSSDMKETGGDESSGYSQPPPPPIRTEAMLTALKLAKPVLISRRRTAKTKRQNTASLIQSCEGLGSSYTV